MEQRHFYCRRDWSEPYLVQATYGNAYKCGKCGSWAYASPTGISAYDDFESCFAIMTASEAMELRGQARERRRQTGEPEPTGDEAEMQKLLKIWGGSALIGVVGLGLWAAGGDLGILGALAGIVGGGAFLILTILGLAAWLLGKGVWIFFR